MTNLVIFIGRFVREHEVVATNSGTTIVKNTLAVDHPFKKDSPSFPRITMFGKTGELANQYTTKGSQVAIEAHYETGSYEKQDGTKVYTHDFIASSIKFLDSKPQGGQAPQQQAPQPTNEPTFDSSDLPF